MTEQSRAGDLADRVRAALEGADMKAIRDLLAPNARWGPGEFPDAGCQNREEVLQWWQRGRDLGLRGRVTEIVEAPGKLLVGLKVTNGPDGQDAGAETDRWQVLTIEDGRIVDIRGFEDRAAAAAGAGVPA